ncbi:MAG: M3 family metallopeptidase [Pseudomonadota bacterium]|nr:M3 family metallopeptidase [Pseudomonadota bacterium]
MNRARNTLLALTITGQLTSCGENVSVAPEQNILIDGIRATANGEQITADCDTALNKAKAEFAALEAQTGDATVDTVFGQYERVGDALTGIGDVWHLRSVHPDADVRDAANKCSEEQSDFFSQIGLSRPYYDRIAAIDTSNLNDVERHMVEESLASFRRSGVDKDEASRQQILDLQNEITAIGNEFDKNIREDVRSLQVEPRELDGLPQDYIDAHPADESGLVTITTDYPDLYPVMTYAKSDDLRKALRLKARSRGYPANKEILEKLIQKRHELAGVLGFESYAALSMDSQMIGSPVNAQDFLNSIGDALETPVQDELAIMLARLQEDQPDAESVEVWQSSYIQNLLRLEDYALDSQEVRTYFQYDRVRDGIFKLTEDLFGVEIEPWDTPTWHEDVETFQIKENGELLGRFYMDNHPRPAKYQHAAHWTLRTGIKDKQIPMSGLAQNFPKGLMEHSQVETFLHEFGHLLHNMFASTQKWSPVAGMSMERDFVEAPSQMLEEWIWDYDTLSQFAINEQGETIPKELVEKMVKARYFGRATGTATQIYYANLSLNFYNRDPESFDLDELMKELETRYAAYPHLPGTHFYANFGHLNGYSSNYYTYQWSLAIATDLFSRFEEAGLRNTEVANDYRRKVLQAAGSKPASDFVADFLGREFSTNAYIKSLQDDG